MESPSGVLHARRFGRTPIPWYECDCKQEPQHWDCKERNGKVDAWAALGTESSVQFEIDNDGDLGIVTNEANSHPMVLVSTLTNDKDSVRYLEIHLVGRESNRDGPGTPVTVTTADRVMTQV